MTELPRMKELDVICLTQDPDGSMTGAIIEVGRNFSIYEVEFVDSFGYTLVILMLEPKQIRLATDQDVARYRRSR